MANRFFPKKYSAEEVANIMQNMDSDDVAFTIDLNIVGATNRITTSDNLPLLPPKTKRKLMYPRGRGVTVTKKIKLTLHLINNEIWFTETTVMKKMKLNVFHSVTLINDIESRIQQNGAKILTKGKRHVVKNMKGERMTAYLANGNSNSNPFILIVLFN